MRQLIRCTTRGGDFPYLPGTRSIRIEQDSLTIPGPGWDLGSTGHCHQSPRESARSVDEPDLALAGCLGLEGDFAAIERPRGMEWQERSRWKFTQPSAIRVSRP